MFYGTIFMEQLPIEMFVHVCSFLSLKNIAHLSNTCHRCYHNSNFYLFYAYCKKIYQRDISRFVCDIINYPEYFKCFFGNYIWYFEKEIDKIFKVVIDNNRPELFYWLCDSCISSSKEVISGIFFYLCHVGNITLVKYLLNSFPVLLNRITVSHAIYIAQTMKHHHIVSLLHQH